MKKIKISNWAKDIVSHIEENAGYELDCKTKTILSQEIEVSIQLNGGVSQRYIDNLITAYRILNAKNKATPSSENAATTIETYTH